MDIRDYLRKLLALHWLRPENAFWRTFDCLLMAQVPFAGKMADLGCGDGTLSYIMAGGNLGSYDAFSHVESLDSFNNGSDIYNKVVTGNALPDIDNSALRHRYHYGVDHKAGLISKAAMLQGFYENTLVHDLNLPLPFAAEAYDAAFSNILYWLDDINTALSDWHRILKPSGKLILFVPNDNFKEKAWFYYQAPHQGHRSYYNFFDRGYNGLIRHAYNGGEWEKIFADNGFVVARHVRYLTDPVMEIWNLGTRPLSPLLINMAAQLPAEKRAQVKEEWIDYFTRFFHPIIEGEFNKAPREKEYAFHFFVLEKKSCA